MKKYNTVNVNKLLILLAVIALIFFASMGGTFAYFTATAKSEQASLPLATIRIGFTTNTDMQVISNGSVVSNMNVLPGDSVAYSGTIENIGDKGVYTILEFSVTVEGNSEPVSRKYYTADGATEITKTGERYTTPATTINTSGRQTFSVSMALDPNTYDNNYKNKKIGLTIIAHALQYDNIADGVTATNIIMDSILNSEPEEGDLYLEVVNLRTKFYTTEPELDISGAELRVWKVGDSTYLESVPLTLDMISGLDNTYVGSYTMIISYKGLTLDVDYTVSHTGGADTN